MERRQLNLKISLHSQSEIPIAQSHFKTNVLFQTLATNFYVKLRTQVWHLGDPMQNEKVIVNVTSDLEEIVPGFLQNRQNELPRLSNSVAIQDFATLRDIGHRLMGNAAGYGFDDLGQLGSKLEKAAAAGDLQAAASIAMAIESYLKNVEVVYISDS